jgi:hypothetical protein
MSPREVIFVDLENLQTFDLAAIPTGASILVFYGINQRKLPEELVTQAQPLGSRLQWIKISGQGPNALDFHIAFYLGRELANNPKSKCIVLSRDTGFDPLIRHAQTLGNDCIRAASVKDALPAREPDPGNFVRLVKLLRKEKLLPTRRKGLAGKIKSWFPELSDGTRQALLQRLFDESLVSEATKGLVYQR